MKLYTEELYNIYMKWVDNVPDEKSTFTPKEIVNAIANIIESNPSLIELPSDEEIEEKAEEVYPISKEYKEKLGANNYDDFNDCWNEGAKWLKEQILNQNK